MEIPSITKFELKDQFLQLLKETQFFGKDEVNAPKHIEEVIKITGYFNIIGVKKDTTILRVFPITFKDAAKRWVKLLPSTLTIMWDNLKSNYL